MTNIKTEITNVIMKFSHTEKRKRKLDAFKDEKQKLEQLSDEELEFEYIELTAECERKSGIFTLFVISIVLAVLMNVWSKFFDFIQKTLAYVSISGGDSMEVVKVSFIISVSVAIFSMAIVFFILFSFVNDINKIKRKLLIIDEIMKKRSTTARTP